MKPLKARISDGGVVVTVPGWRGLKIGPGRCRATIDGKTINGRLVEERKRGGALQLVWRLGATCEIVQQVSGEPGGRLRWRSQLRHAGKKPFVLNRVDLLRIDAMAGGRFDLSTQLGQVRILEQEAARAYVRTAGQILTDAGGSRALDGASRAFVSTVVTAMYSPADGVGLLIGFETFDRWRGEIRAGSGAEGGRGGDILNNVDKASADVRADDAPAALQADQRFKSASIGFGGGDIVVEPGAVVELEQWVMETGDDPQGLLESYADRVGKRYGAGDFPRRSGAWCSWYPYRLAISQDLVLATARAAKARRLDELGVRIFQADLGWQKDDLPTSFEENKRFSRGLTWLSGQLAGMGFDLGVWSGFATVVESHPVARQHPDWLLHDEKGTLISRGQWHWEPHEAIYILDATHPDALEWVRQNIRSLAERGVRYLKWDFGGVLMTPGRRHDRSIAANDAVEGMRRVSEIVRQEMNSQGTEGLVLDNTGSDLPGVGNFKIIHANFDTGNTGIGFDHLHNVYTSYACHAFKNYRWSLLLPSCLVVGLPGTLEEARVRATATFLGAGQIDLSDDLTTLAEERWRVLLSTLPQNTVTARAVDLFHPIRAGYGEPERMNQGQKPSHRMPIQSPDASVWHASLSNDWDQWELVGLFNWGKGRKPSGAQAPWRFQVDFPLIGLKPGKKYWAFEFWSEQFLGLVPIPFRGTDAYRHTGDYTRLVNDSSPGVLDVTFCGPAVKLLVIRRPRPHPWPVGTTFHQSGGLELQQVRWDPSGGELSGQLHRPRGQSGAIYIAGIAENQPLVARVEGKVVPHLVGAFGVVSIPLATRSDVTHWSIRIKE
jgi:hypothetical protein